MVNLKSVTVTHKNGTTALRRVSLRIDDGEFVLVNGHSGAGKSTIVRLLTAEDVPTSGEVVIDGINTKSLTHRQIPKFRRRLGVVFQDFRLIPTMTVFDNIAFAMRAVGRRRKEIKKRVATVMEIVGLTGKEKSLPSQLSGGEQQRVALARAIVNNPKMIIADEPTGNIDPKMSEEVMDMFRLINQTGITVIVVTHEQIFVETLGARVITLDHGTILNDTAHPEVAEELLARREAEEAEAARDEEPKNETEKSSEKTEASEVEKETPAVSEEPVAESVSVEAEFVVPSEEAPQKGVEQKAEEFLASIGIDTEKIRAEQPTEIVSEEQVSVSEEIGEAAADDGKEKKEADAQ